MDVFVLHHTHEFDDDSEDVKLIGVYSSFETAQAAIERLSELPGFCDMPTGFIITRYQLDEDNWITGYVTVS
jgi:type IV secretory pathway component VirB8